MTIITKFIKFLIHVNMLPAAKFFPKLLFEQKFTRIVNMHNPSPEALDGILSALKIIAPLISYDKVIDAKENGQQPPPGFVISFDDGYRQNLQILDILDKHGCKAIFFISTGPMSSEKPLWFFDQTKFNYKIKDDLKNSDYLAFQKKSESLGLLNRKAHTAYGINADHVRQIANRGHKIATHTINHPFLTKLTDQEIALEVLGGYRTLQKCLGTKNIPLDFAYPDGDFDDRVIEVLKNIGVRSAVTIDHKNIDMQTDILQIGRFGAADDDFPGYALFKQSTIYKSLFLSKSSIVNQFTKLLANN